MSLDDFNIFAEPQIREHLHARGGHTSYIDLDFMIFMCFRLNKA